MPRDRREYQRIYYQENREAIRKRQNERNATHPRNFTEEQKERGRERCRKYYYDNRHKSTEKRRQYYQDNKESIIAKNHQYAVEHPEQTRRYAKNWAAANPEKTEQHARTRDHIRRAKKRGTTSEKFDPLEIFERDDWVCGICLEPISRELGWPDPMSKSLDHEIPLSKGGTHTKENCQAAHLRCNQKKGTKVPAQEEG